MHKELTWHDNFRAGVKFNRAELVINFILACSIFSPIILPPISFFQLMIWPLFVVLWVISWGRMAKANSKNFLFLHIFVFSIVLSIILSFSQIASPPRSLLPAIGGAESYLQIYCACVFSALSFRLVRLGAIERFVAIYISTILALSVLTFLFDPELARQVIDGYSFGIENTGQWRFTSFFGLPYYAGAAFVILSMFVLRHYRASTLTLKARLYLVFVFMTLVAGGLLTASKTFLAGLCVLLTYFFFGSSLSLRQKLIFFALVSVFILISYTLTAGSSFDYDEFFKIISLLLSNTADPMSAIIFRYSQDNYAVSNLFSDQYWYFFYGTGVNAEALATDSQWRDLLYRFGALGLLSFSLFTVLILFLSDNFFRAILMILLIGSIGSNTLTPINFTFFIWYLIFLNIFQRRGVKWRPAVSA